MAETQAQKAKRIAAENALRIKNERQKEATKKKLEESKKKLKEEINDLNKKKAIQITFKTKAEQDLATTKIQLKTETDPLIIAGLLEDEAAYKVNISGRTTTIKNIDAKIADKNASIKTLNKKLGLIPTTTTSNTVTDQSGAFEFTKDYKYNAPMVNSAYFGSKGIQAKALDGNRIDQGKYTDALNAWTGVDKGGRGTIQMDNKFMNNIKDSMTKDMTALDPQKYGFKFLYNPTTVSMAWGVLQNMDPPFEASGADKFSVVSTGIMSATVEFDLMLNRIGDFTYLNETGLISQTPNPYPDTVLLDDQKEIYAKGTMYDLEYLFRTINGPHGNFKSELRGNTADRGWMYPTIVELHLGASMRYRVRINSFSVNHIMFNSRMVPILSSVRLSCNRYVDGPLLAKGSGVSAQNGQLYGISDPAKLKALGSFAP